MKKTIQVTLSQIVFNIEEDAYNILEKYLGNIEDHYKKPEEREEILADIESSIAEKFSAKIKKYKNVITVEDVEGVVEVMGTVADFENNSSEVEREEEELVLNKEIESARRLYRNPDDVIIAGVCSGIAAYFGIDPVFIRILFALSVFAGGFGFVAYILLWVIVPEAKSRAQKLEMMGKPVDLKRIEEVVKEKSKMVKTEGKEAIEKLRKKKILYRIINFPIKICGAIIIFIKKFFKVLGPVILISFGIVFLISALAGILGLTIAVGLLLFSINSPYIVSDLPIAEIANSSMYYVAVIAAYIIAVVPLFFIGMLSFTMIRRKNSFRAFSTGLLIGIWMLGIAAGVVAAGDLAPKIYKEVNNIQQAERMVREYDYDGFEKLYLGGSIHAEVKQGNEFSIVMTGREKDLDRLEFVIEDEQLQITQKRRQEENKLCVFCFDKNINAVITVPELKSFVGIGNSQTELVGFTKDLYISLGEVAQLDYIAQDQNIECKLSGMYSNFYLSGDVQELSCEMDGYSRLNAEDLKANSITLNQSVYSRATLVGEVEKLEADMESRARLYALELETQEVALNTNDYSRVEITARNIFKLSQNEYSRVTYAGNPEVEEITGDEDYIEKINIVSLED